MQPPGESPRERLSVQIANIRALLASDPTGAAVSPASLSPEELERLANAGAGVLGCILLSITPMERQPRPEGLPADARRDDQMVNVALQLLAPMVRNSDVLVRLGGPEVACLLPGTGPLEARGVAWRLRGAVEGRDFWFHEQPFRISCKAGVSARGTRGVGDDLRSLIDAARRNPVT
jgi:hypothetical protein